MNPVARTVESGSREAAVAAGPVIPAALRAALADYRLRLSSRFGDRLRFVRLFGSWARGEADEDSDIDVAVAVDGLSRNEWRDAISDAVDVELTADMTLSPFVVSSEHFDFLLCRERRIANDILNDGIAL